MVEEAFDEVAPAVVSLPVYCSNLNPAERSWLRFRERFLSHRLFAGLGAVMDACCQAWSAVANQPKGYLIGGSSSSTP